MDVTNQQSEHRLAGYDYLQILKEFLGENYKKIFSGEAIYPRQLEIHLPADHKTPCEFKCYYCQGALVDHSLGLDEKKTLKLLDEIGPNKFGYHIYGGVYTEPLASPYLLDFIHMSVKHGVNFGIHTNGASVKKLEEEKGTFTEIFSIMKKEDYISVSLDAGTPESHMKTKGLKQNFFDDIIDGIRIMTALKCKNPENPAVRICYLLNKFNSSEKELQKMVELATDLQVDSLRFSIPYAPYGQSFNKVRNYKKRTETSGHQIYEKRLEKFTSKSLNKSPYVFYFPPVNQDVDRMNYRYCVYGYYQITFGADGNVYRCSSIASPSFSYGILAPLPDSKKKLEKLILENQDPDFNCSTCFNENARCNRLALEINSAFNEGEH